MILFLLTSLGFLDICYYTLESSTDTRLILTGFKKLAATDEWTTVFTTLPNLGPSSARTHTTTARLLIRPLLASDLDGLHALRTQPEVMAWSAVGRIDYDLAETADKLAQFLPPHDTSTFNCAMCLKETGELIGCGGVHKLNRENGRDGVGPVGGYGWPELGYMFKKEYWGCGLASEFVEAFLGMWEELPRKEVELRVNAKSVVERASSGRGGEDGPKKVAEEVLIAIIDPTNGASQRILDKCGFAKFDAFTEKHGENPEKHLELFTYRYFPKANDSSKKI